MPGGSIGSLIAGVRLDTSRLQGDVTKAQRTFRTFEKGGGRAFRGVTAALGPLNTALLGTAAALGGLAAFRGAADAGIEFGRSMAQVRGIMRATNEEFGSLTEAARKAGEATEFTATQASEALVKLGMTGFDAAQSIGALPGVLDLATGAQLDFGRVADISTNILQGFGLKAEDSEQLMMNMNRVADVMVGTFTRTNTTMEELADSMKFVAPVAKAMGYSVEETAGLIGKLGDAGLKGGIAGRNLATAMLRAQKAAARFGFESGDLIDVIRDLEKRGASVTDIMTLFGLRSSKAVLVLKDSQGAVRKLQQGLHGVQGESKDLADTMRNTVWGSFQKVKAIIESVALDAFMVYGDELQGLLIGTRNFISRHKKDIQDFVSKIADGFERAVPIIMKIGEGVRDSISIAITSFKLFSDKIKDNEMELGGSLENIGMFFLNLLRVGRFVLLSFGSIFGSTAGLMILLSAEIIDAIKAFPEFALNVGRAVKTIVDLINEAIIENFNKLENKLDEFKTNTNRTFDSINKRFDKTGKLIGRIIDPFSIGKKLGMEFDIEFTGFPDTKTVDDMNKFKKELMEMGETIASEFERAFGTERAEKVREQFNVIVEEMDPVKNGLKEAADATISAVEAMIPGIEAAFVQLEESLDGDFSAGEILSSLATINKEVAKFKSGFEDVEKEIREFYKTVKGNVLTGGEGVDSAKKALDAQVRLLKELVEETGISQTELLRRWEMYKEARLKQIQAEEWAMHALEIPAEQIKEVLEKRRRDLDRMLEDLLEKNKETAGIMQELWKATAESMATDMRSIFIQTLEGEFESFKDFVKAVFEEITAAWRRALADMAAQKLSDVMGGFSLGDFLGDLFKFIPGVGGGGGGPLLDLPVPGGPGGDVPLAAAGGIFTRPTMAVIGEAGPEAVIPLARMQDESFTESLGIAGGVSEISQTFIFNDSTPSRFAQSQSQVAARAAVSLHRAVVRS